MLIKEMQFLLLTGSNILPPPNFWKNFDLNLHMPGHFYWGKQTLENGLRLSFGSGVLSHPRGGDLIARLGS